jgi:hypothetical protein
VVLIVVVQCIFSNTLWLVLRCLYDWLSYILAVPGETTIIPMGYDLRTPLPTLLLKISTCVSLIIPGYFHYGTVQKKIPNTHKYPTTHPIHPSSNLFTLSSPAILRDPHRTAFSTTQPPKFNSHHGTSRHQSLYPPCHLVKTVHSL